MADFALDPLRDEIVVRALIETLVLAMVCGPLGTWVLLFRQSYAAESLAHGMLPGLVAATLVGVPLALGAGGGALLAAGAIALAGRDRRLGADLGVAVAVTGLLGAGALLALAPEAPARLEELLFGSLLGVTWGEVAVGGSLALVVLGGLAVNHRRLTLAAFDPAAAASLGTRSARAELLLLVLLGLAVVAAVQALGNLLVLALLIAPAAAAARLTPRLARALVLSAAIAALAGLLGIYASYHLELAAGASVALAALALLAATALVRERAHTLAAAG